jgi:hypothetical protein
LLLAFKQHSGFYSAIWKAVMLALPSGIYVLHCWNGLRSHYIHTKCNDDWFRQRYGYYHNLRIRKVGTTDGRDLWSTPLRWLHVALHTHTYIQIGTGIQAVLRLCVTNMSDCNAGTIVGQDLRIMPLRWAQVSCYIHQFHKDWFRHSEVVRRANKQYAQSARWSHKPTFIIQNKECRIIKRVNFLWISFHLHENS